MKTKLLTVALLFAITGAFASDNLPPNIGYITVNWTTNTNCNPLKTGDKWIASMIILNYPLLTTFWPLHQSDEYIDRPTYSHNFDVDQPCNDSQAQYLVIAVVRLIREGIEIGRGEYRTVMSCYDLYQLANTGIDIEVICN